MKESPLNESHLQMINEGLAKFDEGIHHIELAKRAGIDVTDHEKDIHHHGTRLRQIKQVYFPGR